MRYAVITILTLLIFSPYVSAQGLGGAKPGIGLPPQKQPLKPALPKLNPHKNPVDWLLVKWERAMGGVKSLSADCTNKSVDKVFGHTKMFKGTAKYMKTPTASLASLQISRVGMKDDYKKFIITGTFLYEYDPKNKLIRIHNMPKPPPGQVAADNSFLSFLFGMRAAEAKARYHLEFIKQDKWYYYMGIKPKLAKDKGDFSRARLVLLKTTFMPRQLWFEEPNGNEISWDFPRITSPAQMSVLEFQQPRLPAGWQFRRMPALNRPKVNTPR